MAICRHDGLYQKNLFEFTIRVVESDSRRLPIQTNDKLQMLYWAKEGGVSLKMPVVKFVFKC